jgi:hypothetical protein
MEGGRKEGVPIAGRLVSLASGPPITAGRGLDADVAGSDWHTSVNHIETAKYCPLLGSAADVLSTLWQCTRSSHHCTFRGSAGDSISHRARQVWEHANATTC